MAVFGGFRQEFVPALLTLCLLRELKAGKWVITPEGKLGVGEAGAHGHLPGKTHLGTDWHLHGPSLSSLLKTKQKKASLFERQRGLPFPSPVPTQPHNWGLGQANGRNQELL